MSYLHKSMQEGERPLCRSHLHWIYLMAGLFWFAGLTLLGWTMDYNLWIHFGQYIPAYEINLPDFRIAFAPGWIGWGMTAGGAFILLNELIKFSNTDLIMTNKRLLYKTGFIKIKVDATDIGDILGVHIDQGWFGQFFGYGKIHLDCRFIDDVYIPYVKNPYGIMKALQKAKAGEPHAAAPMDEVSKNMSSQGSRTQTLIQVLGPGPVYFVDKVPEDPKRPLKELPKDLGSNMLNAFRRKA